MYQLVPTFAVAQALNSASTTLLLPLGTIARIQDQQSPGLLPQGGEAIYVKVTGAGVVQGSMCDYDPYLGTAVLSPATGGTGAVGVAFTTIPANSYGWLQIAGSTAVKAPNAMVVGADVFSLAATPGSVDDAAVAGEQIVNAKVSTTTGTPSTGLAMIEINRPFHQGAIL